MLVLSNALRPNATKLVSNIPLPIDISNNICRRHGHPYGRVNLCLDLGNARILTCFLTAIYQSFHHVVHCRRRESCLRLKDGNDPSMNWLRFVEPFVHPAPNKLSGTWLYPGMVVTHIFQDPLFGTFIIWTIKGHVEGAKLTHNGRLFARGSISERGRLQNPSLNFERSASADMHAKLADILGLSVC